MTYELVVVDAAQIEARVLAWMAEEEWLLQAFREERDIYSEFASVAYGRTITKADTQERFVGKTCIAEDELVLTNYGLVPIQIIKSRHKLWDGVQWVSHDGLIDKGIQDVITYQGLTATPDHVVVTEDGRALPLWQAASEMVRLERTGFGKSALWTRNRNFLEHEAGKRVSEATLRMQQVWDQEVDKHGQPAKRKNKRMPELFSDAIKALRSSGTTIRCNSSPVYKQIAQALQKLWSPRNTEQIQDENGVHSVDREEPAAQGLQRNRNRSGKQRRTLRAWKFAFGYTTRTDKQSTEHSQNNMGRQADTSISVCQSVYNGVDVQTSCERQTNGATDTKQVHVYDIANAGPRFCFTVSGKLVFNCVLGLGFQMGGTKLQTTLLTQSINQGLDPVRLAPEICFGLVNAYRATYTQIKDLWKYANDEIIAAMLTGRSLRYKCLSVEKGKINLPNGLALLYPGLDANIVKTRFGETVHDASYLSARSRTKIYSGLVVENFVQALARIIVADVMRIIANKYRVVMITHDEIVFVAPKKEASAALKWAIGLMSASPSWAPDLPLSAEGGHAENYSK